VSKAAESYQSKSGQNIVVNAGGSGSGFNQLAEGQTDIGMMSRDITAGELADFSAHSFTPITIGRDAVVPVVSSEIYDAGVRELSLEDIAKIYRGEISNWAELGGPDVEIFVIDKEASSGTRQTFMEIVLGDPKAEAPAANLVIGSNNEEQTALTQSNAAIGMLSIAWLNEDVKGLSIKTSSGLITPTLENISNGRFPIVRDLNIIVREDISPRAQAFVDYLLSPAGQVFVERSGYIKAAP
jgi:phosphate transport system substrate-binding protein